MSTKVLAWPEIEKKLVGLDVVGAMEAAFDAFSQGLAVIPPVGELTFEKPPGDVHIKYGYLKEGSHYVVKIASGFYNNPKLGLSSCQGMMLLFDQATGVPATILLDEGKLTDIRTGAAGAAAAKHLAPKEVQAIGVLGAGIQARMQLKYLAEVSACRKVVVWNRTEEHAVSLCEEIAKMGFNATVVGHPRDVALNANLIITTTPSREPLLSADWIQPGTHITAVGSDTADKQELDSKILSKARVVADSLAQSESRGEIYRAVEAGDIDRSSVVELGNVMGGRSQGRMAEDEITIADLTGVAVQDLAIATAVFKNV
ncbi:MAG: ornithine cyclodeaminase family protein [Deltaproteobacteria bacterium]|nr:ornithine cyclodeaminase family protein [Deltaproteobacteria bacterium]